MAPLASDPTALDRAGATVVATGVALGSVITTLDAALAGSLGMSGDDPVGAALGRAYDGAAAKLIATMTSTRSGLCSIGDGVRMSAHNYALAEAMSDVTGRAGSLPTPPVTAPLTVGASPPSAVGAGSGAPAGWSWVAPYIGMIWPTGDSAKLRAAAAAWATAGANFMATETAAGGGTIAAIGAQQIPEGAAITGALADASNASTSIAQQSQTIAAQLNSYAAKIDRVHAAILDLLSRICDPMTGIKEVWDLLTDEDEDEIKRIADDIRTVVDSFAQEAETLGAQIKATMSATAAAADVMGHWAGREWDHFLHGTEVGRALNQTGQGFKGFGVEGWDFLKGLWNISQGKLLTDPVGYGKNLGDLASGAAPLVGLGPDRGPGVADSWKALGKDITHWDEWGSNPAEALGKSIFDVSTLALPGGPLSKLGKAGSRAADVLKGLEKPPEIPKVPSVKPPSEPPPAGPKPPEPGHPAPSGKPVPGPADGPLPHSPTESKPPVGETPHSGEPKPIGVPPESGGKPPVSAPAEGTPPPHPKPAEPTLTRVPPTVPAAAAPAASMPAASAPSMPSMPSLPEPPSLPSVPTGGLPAETPPAAGIPHGGEPGAPPSGPPHPPDVTPPGSGDGDPHGPSDGDPNDPNGHGPHDPSPDNGSDHHLPLHPLTSDDLAALAHYTGPGYQDLNFALREGALDASQQARVDALHNALEKLPMYEGAVVRGTNLPADVLEEYRPGEIITEPAFTSTSTDHAVAQSPTFAGNTEFRIWSTTGRDVSSASMYPGEQEILFPAGSKFYVISKLVDPQTGRTIIEMIER